MPDYFLQGLQPQAQGGLRSNFTDQHFAGQSASTVSRRAVAPNSFSLLVSQTCPLDIKIEYDEAAITTSLIKALAPGAKPSPEAHAKALEAARKGSSLNTIKRVSAFLGQIFVETTGYTLLEENLNYTTTARLRKMFSNVKGEEDAKALIAAGPEAIANRVYGGRQDLANGDEKSGDGWKYRGSGHKQLTGRYNYDRIGKEIGLDLINNPEWAREMNTSAKIAVAYWEARKCSKFADVDDHDSITLNINGKQKEGLAKRKKASIKAEGIMKRASATQAKDGGLSVPSSLYLNPNQQMSPHALDWQKLTFPGCLKLGPLQ
jgi:putative chitinase